MTEPPIGDYLREFYGRHIELEYLAGAEFVLDECLRCRLVFQRWVPGEALIRKLYEEWINPDEVFEEHRRTDDARYHRELADEVAMILALVGKTPADVRVLDFGMGWGNWARMAGAFGCRAFGTEVSERRIAHASAFGVTTVTLETEHLEPFDVVNADQVFEHLVAPLATLKELARRLKPGGLLKISVPNGGGIRWLLRLNDWRAPKDSWKSLNPVSPLEHLNCFTNRSLLAMGREAGLVPLTLPLSVQYRDNTLHQGSLRAVAKFAVRPALRRFGWATYQFFRKPGG